MLKMEQTALMQADEKTQITAMEFAQSDIKNLIYIVRNQQVMLDSDLAMLYHVETKVFNQAVKRNIARFPDNFRFQISKDEYEALRSQVVTQKRKILMATKKAEEDIYHMFLLNRESQCYRQF